MLADRAVELMREAPPPSVDARPESSPIVSVSPREEAPHLDDAAPVELSVLPSDRRTMSRHERCASCLRGDHCIGTIHKKYNDDASKRHAK